jgi:hypothetical protein
MAQIMSLKQGESLSLVRRVPLSVGAGRLAQQHRDEMKNRLASPVNTAKRRGLNLRLETASTINHDADAILVVAVITRTA